MSRRIDIELTSTRPDGTWTWRAAGAKKPKGDVEASVLPQGAKVGDVLRVEVESYLDGLTITAVLPPKDARSEPERLEIVGSRRGDDQLVTSTLVERRGGRDRPDRGERRDRGDRPGRGDRERARGPRPDARGPRPEGAAAPGDRRGGSRPSGPRPERTDRPARRERPAPPAAPKPARLRAGRTHRNAVLAALPEEQKPIAEQLLRGGIPGVRQAVDKQNEAARAEGRPEIKAEALLGLAEQLLPQLRTAEWRDKAEAAIAGIDEIDLRDLRTVVVAADTAARDEESRDLAQRLRDGLTARVEGEHAAWLAELAELVGDGRTVRALRLSSRPPKAGAPLPADLAGRLAAAAGEGLAADIGQDRWATLVDAVALSPVRLAVVPAGIPAEPGDELKAAVTRVASRVPQIAERLGISPEAPTARRGAGPRGRKPPAPGRRGAPGAPPRTAPPADQPAASADTPEPAVPADTPEPAVPAETPERAVPADTPEPAVPAETPEPAAPAADAPEPAASSQPEASGDRAEDAVLVEELGESVDK